ncbi:MAG: hypothetical protein HJJLKODD_01734 [Phycisphaerae bacterium]|nr:hypothetical protein [Phycisphaerae bacterium]
MVGQPRKDIQDIIREVGKYPLDAYQFVHDGLTHTLQSTHGELTDAELAVHHFMAQNNIDLEMIATLAENGQLPERIAGLIEQLGGIESLNRHVSGEKLCWGLRDYAMQRWGALASTVLQQWNIKSTRDFGEIVFALVDNNYLQKQPTDQIEDFEEVFRFNEAFDRAYRINLSQKLN